MADRTPNAANDTEVRRAFQKRTLTAAGLAADVATNTADIATNVIDIASNDTDILNLQVEVDGNAYDKTGWSETVLSEVTLTFTDGTRTVAIAPMGADASYYINGTKYTFSTEQSVAIDNTEGIWFIYFDGSTLTATQDIWTFDNTKAFVMTLYWDAINGNNVGYALQLHSWDIQDRLHKYLHFSFGTRFENGLGVALADTATVNVAPGELRDEDISVLITDDAGSGWWDQTLSPLTSPIFYRSGAGVWRKIAASTSLCHLDTNIPQVNIYSGTWQWANVTVNQYFAYWVVASSDNGEPVYLVPGQEDSTSLNNAIADNQLANMAFDGLPTDEHKVIARMIIKRKVASPYYELIQIDDYRYEGDEVVGTGSAVSDHGILTGLSDDDHAQYHNDARADTWLGLDVANATEVLTSDGAGGYTWAVPNLDHGTLTGRADDDHTQYHTDARAATWIGLDAAAGATVLTSDGAGGYTWAVVAAEADTLDSVCDRGNITNQYVDAASFYADGVRVVYRPGASALFLGDATAATFGNYVTAVGLGALGAATGGDGNTAVGYNSLNANTSGTQIVPVGAFASENNDSGTGITALGYHALRASVIGVGCTAVGQSALSKSLADSNTAVGSTSLFETTSGTQNTAMGAGAGHDNVTGSRNVFMGVNAGYSETGSDKLYIANTTTATPLIYGEFDNGFVQINGRLEIEGTTSAFVNARLTTIQRDALTPVNGMVIYNTDTDLTESYEDNAWITSVPGGSVGEFEVLTWVNDEWGWLASAKIVVAEENVFVTTTGNDTTGDGSIGLPWATIDKALEEVGQWVLTNFVNINIEAGTYPAATLLTWDLSFGHQVRIRGDYATDTLTWSSVSTAGGRYFHVCSTGGGSTDDYTVGQYVTCYLSTGGTYPQAVLGTLLVTAKVANTSVTLQTPTPSGAIAGGATMSISIPKVKWQRKMVINTPIKLMRGIQTQFTLAGNFDPIVLIEPVLGGLLTFNHCIWTGVEGGVFGMLWFKNPSWIKLDYCGWRDMYAILVESVVDPLYTAATQMNRGMWIYGGKLNSLFNAYSSCTYGIYIERIAYAASTNLIHTSNITADTSPAPNTEGNANSYMA